MPLQIRNMDSKEYKDKLEWVKGLRVGDVVCDCRFRHLRISKIENNTVVFLPSWIRNIIFSDLLPFFLSNWLEELSYFIARYFGKTKVVDRSVILEDGASCSAMNCCDPPNHSHNAIGTA